MAANYPQVISRCSVITLLSDYWNYQGRRPAYLANEDSVHLQQSHFLKLPSFDGIYGKSRAMSTPLLLMNTLLAGCEPRLPGSLNAMKGINLLSHLASMPFSAAISLFLRLLNLSKPDTAMTKSQSNSCATSFATTKWSCAFHDSLTPFMLCSHNRHSPVGLRGGSDEWVENWLGGAGKSGPEGRPSNTGEAGVSGAGLFGA